MTPAEYVCWISLFVILVLLFFHQTMIADKLKIYSEIYGNSTINSIFRVENLLKERKGTILWIEEENGVKYEIIKHTVEESKDE